MTAAVLAALAVAALSLAAVSALARLVSSERRQGARERERLTDQLMHLSGRTWTPPPSVNGHTPPEPVALSYTVHPEGFDWSDTDA